MNMTKYQNASYEDVIDDVKRRHQQGESADAILKDFEYDAFMEAMVLVSLTGKDA